jgi:hypothetical protein
MILVRRYSVKDGHLLKRPTKTSLFRFLHDNQIADSPRLKTPKTKDENFPCDECTEPLPCDAENLEQCKKKRGVEEE